jgi:hypothetical protein
MGQEYIQTEEKISVCLKKASTWEINRIMDHLALVLKSLSQDLFIQIFLYYSGKAPVN